MSQHNLGTLDPWVLAFKSLGNQKKRQSNYEEQAGWKFLLVTNLFI